MSFHKLQETSQGKRFLYLPEAWMERLGWEKGDVIQLCLGNEKEGEEESHIKLSKVKAQEVA